MTYDNHIGVVGLQASEQCMEGMLLGRSAGVGRSPVLVQATLVADADGAVVVTLGVRTDHLLRTAYVQLAVARDVVMVAAHLEAAGAVTGVEGLEGERAVAARCGAVNHC